MPPYRTQVCETCVRVAALPSSAEQPVTFKTTVEIEALPRLDNATGFTGWTPYQLLAG